MPEMQVTYRQTANARTGCSKKSVLLQLPQIKPETNELYLLLEYSPISHVSQTIYNNAPANDFPSGSIRNERVPPPSKASWHTKFKASILSKS